LPSLCHPFTGRPTDAIAVDLSSEVLFQDLGVIVTEASTDCSAATFLLRLIGPEEESATTHRNLGTYVTTVMTQCHVPETPISSSTAVRT